MFWKYAIYFYLAALIFLGLCQIEIISAAAWTAVAMALVTWISWNLRVPHGLKMFLTVPIMQGIIDFFVGFVGWFILPNSSHAKAAFIFWHGIVTLSLVHEHARLRGTLFPKLPKETFHV